jgi:hypothetical protein
MKLVIRDWMFIGLVVVVLAVFYAISGKEKTKLVPHNPDHERFHEMIKAGKKKSEVDPLCAECHDGVRIRFPENHPAKPGAGPMRCLFCHKIKQ